MFALLAEASKAGSWCAVVGLPALGAVAAADTGIVLERLALVPNPGPEWATVAAALIDGVDVVVIAAPGTVSASIASRLAARARQRGSVLVPYGRWEGADITLRVTRGRWDGLGDGHGRLRRREVTIVAQGRGAAAQPKEITVWMPTTGTGPRATVVPVVPVTDAPGRGWRSSRATWVRRPSDAVMTVAVAASARGLIRQPSRLPHVVASARRIRLRATAQRPPRRARCPALP